MPTYKSLKDYVFDYISHQIHIGILKPNEKINESSICEVLQVSRTPVREALIQLADEGILENLPRRGFTVSEVNLNKVKEIYSIIGVLEGFAAYEAVSKISEEDIELLLQYIVQMDDCIGKGDYDSYYKKQLKFHEILINSCGNAELINLIQKLKKKFVKQSYIIDIVDDGAKNISTALNITNSEHKKIYKLVKEKKGKELEDYLRNVHWNVTYAKYDTTEP